MKKIYLSFRIKIVSPNTSKTCIYAELMGSLCFSTERALLTETQVESGDVSKQKWNLS